MLSTPLRNGDIFDIQISLLSKQFENLIPDQDQLSFRTALACCAREAFLQTQVNLVARGDELATVLFRLQQQKTSRPPLEAMLKHCKDDAQVVSRLKTAMFD
ncbi:hypothetical protein BM1_10849 [Bipolaris maydis]|nr:hypothetical protein BM1_10849 [Bipolaris maydis]KAJ5024615.1 hypothetical protein J3E73DRAFT_371344 [Bipolaris maydis]KAJ6281397.1 hypothetical protein J3E71DRAFT_343540 [Bipolaris maydis]